jgi:hypothetical protein
MKKTKIINDPVYGFISIPSDLILEILYPGALHTRFQHALGAMHLMGKVLDTLRVKGTEISDEEYEASQLAILLHDVGHGPFSHALEDVLIPGANHESLSYLMMDRLNASFDGALTLTIKIFRNSYHRKFFHELISSQLDIDRLDYLRRDSFFTGVQEGTIGVDRIIAMLAVHHDHLVVEEKGIYSIESFLNARRLMYWQVYLHKTTVSTERMLVNLIRRAQALVRAGEKLNASDALHLFLQRDISLSVFQENPDALTCFGQLDDNDIWGGVKYWRSHSDRILAMLAQMMLERKLFRIKLGAEPIRRNQIEKIRELIMQEYGTLRSESSYLFSHGTVTNEAYAEGQEINILMRNGELLDIAQASDLPNIKAISKIVKKNYLCWPKNVSLSGS